MTPSGKYRQVRSATCSIIGCFAALVSILLLSPSEINAGPKVTAHTEYYAIRGSNARELRAQMDKLGVPHSDGKIWDAFYEKRYQLAVLERKDPRRLPDNVSEHHG